MSRKRCFGGEDDQGLYARYHDEEWGKPVYEDHLLFEMLILEGAQAGLSWETVLKRREGYRQAFYQFNPEQVAEMSDETLENLMEFPGIIRHRKKIFSARQNAQIFLKIQKEYGSFALYLWGFVNHQPQKRRCTTLKELPTRTLESDLLAKDLKRRGMSFIGSTIMYAYMQAVGLTNDHLIDCWCN